SSSAARLGFATLPNFIAQQLVQDVLLKARCNDQASPALSGYFATPVPFQSAFSVRNIMDTYFSVYIVRRLTVWDYTTAGSQSVIDQFAAGDETLSTAAVVPSAYSTFENMDDMFGGPFM